MIQDGLANVAYANRRRRNDLVFYAIKQLWFTFSQRQLRPAYYMLKFIPDARFYHLLAFLL